MERKRVIIVGASSGIGHAIACKYVERGWRVGITGRRLELLNGLREQHPQQVVISCFDVTGSENHQRIGDLIGRLDGLDLLVYSAGCGEPSEELDLHAEDITTRTNVLGFVSIAGYAFDYFVRQGYGQLAVLSSVAALRGNSQAPAYSASKAYMSIYAEGLNLKAGQLGKDIVVTDIRPGFVNTKPARGNRRFWVAPVAKAAAQIVSAIDRKKRVVYITRRWWLVVRLFKLIPFWLYRRVT